MENFWLLSQILTTKFFRVNGIHLLAWAGNSFTRFSISTVEILNDDDQLGQFEAGECLLLLQRPWQELFFRTEHWIFFRIISAEACFVLLFSQFLYPDDLVFESPIFFLRTRRATNFQTQIFDSSSAFQLELRQGEHTFEPSTEDTFSHLIRSNLKWTRIPRSTTLE